MGWIFFHMKLSAMYLCLIMSFNLEKALQIIKFTFCCFKSFKNIVKQH